MILFLRTESPVAVFGLWNEVAGEVAMRQEKELGRSMAKELPGELEALIGDLKKLTGIVVFKGPGSFTGLRIGITIANALAYSLDIPVAAAQGDDWIAKGIGKLSAGENERIVVPEYGGEAHITQPRK